MATGDKVKVGYGSIPHGFATDNVPVFDLEKYPNTENHKLDSNGCVYPRAIGGIKGGSVGTVMGDAMRARKSDVDRSGTGAAAFGGTDYVMLFPVFFEHYQKTGWIYQEHIHVIG